jgi:predicted ATP-dependent serine protease
MVDYLQCISTERATPDRRAEINHIARTLTDVIKTCGCAGILSSQLTGEDIRESRDVEHAVEVVLIGRKNESAMQLFVKKNKCGPKDVVIDLEWDDLNGSFRSDIGDALVGDWDVPTDPRPDEWDGYRA